MRDDLAIDPSLSIVVKIDQKEHRSELLKHFRYVYKRAMFF